jgi:Tripartite tricarboxylate transporter TctB family
MNDRTLVRGLFLVAISLAFGLQALRYPIGTFSRAGAGLFPLIVSSLLLLIGIITVVRSRFETRLAIDFNLKNIAIILASLCGFAVISAYLNMIAGITFMVFFSSLAARTYSPVRCLKVSAGLIAVAFAFQKLLGFNLPLY